MIQLYRRNYFLKKKAEGRIDWLTIDSNQILSVGTLWKPQNAVTPEKDFQSSRISAKYSGKIHGHKHY